MKNEFTINLLKSERAYEKNSKKENQKNRDIGCGEKILMLAVIPMAFLIFALVNANMNEILSGLLRINTSTTILFTDFLVVGGVPAAFFNAAMTGFFSLFLLDRFKMKINGMTIAAFMTVIGFSLFGKNIFNIIPIYAGGYMYCRFQRIPLKNAIVALMFATGLAPIVSEIAFYRPMLSGHMIALGIAIGVFIGFIITPLSSHMLRFHDGYNLYNIGFTAGILGTVFTSILRSFDMEIVQQNILYGQDSQSLKIFLCILFAYLIAIGIFLDRDALKRYNDILQHKGRLITDFTQTCGYGKTFVNMGIMGILSLAFVVISKGVLNGPVMAGIFTVVGFAAFGKHPKNTLPIILGVAVGTFFTNHELSSTAVIISALFGTTIAPIAGRYGFPIGVLAGVLHLFIVTNIGVVHGGVNLYNNGFSGGIVAGVMVPVIDAFRKEDN